MVNSSIVRVQKWEGSQENYLQHLLNSEYKYVNMKHSLGKLNSWSWSKQFRWQVQQYLIKGARIPNNGKDWCW